MKSLIKEKENFLINHGFAEDEEMLYEVGYRSLSDEEKKQYKYVENKESMDEYVKEANIPEYSEKEFENILKLVVNKNLENIEKHLKVIKGCVTYFTVLTTIGLIYTIISIMSLLS